MEAMKVRPIEKNKISRVNKAKLRQAHIDKTEKSSIQDIEALLGLDKVKPIILTDADVQDTIEKGDYFRDWYEEEVRELHEQCKY